MNSPNNLIHETSPYLLQHANNPVNWHPWNNETLYLAKQENKMLLISIGYSACHWCHVMEKESFEDEAVAMIMNKNFVCVKVDREEHPDVDQIYMEAVQMITGRGGWPLNCFALPDGRPVWGGTYFRKNQWMEILENISLMFDTRPDELEKQAENITGGIKKEPLINIENELAEDLFEEDLKQFYDTWSNRFDHEKGGNLGAPKFPMPNNHLFLLMYYFKTKNREILEYVNLSLTKMALGGIYDHLGGGFARYATDEDWKVPHFEKMLYDNAQLISLYSMAYQLTKKELYKKVVFETINFIKRELMAENGGFYSALDADSEGEEGKYYVWTSKEMEEILGEDAAWFIDYFEVDGLGLWEKGNSILLRKSEAKSPPSENLEMLKEKLLAAREKRIKPGLDDKILTSWNALMIRGLVDAYNTFGEPEFLELAVNNADFLLRNLSGSKGNLFHVFSIKGAKIAGYLEDYAFLIEALLELFQASFDSKWLDKAKELIAYVIKHFKAEHSSYFYFTSDETKQPVARKFELMDNVTPSSNATLARSLLRLGRLLDKEDYINTAKSMLAGIRENMIKYGSAFSNWGQLTIELSDHFYLVAITGTKAQSKRKELAAIYLPGKVIVGSELSSDIAHLKDRFIEGQTLIWVCTENACQRPVNEVDEAVVLLVVK